MILVVGATGLLGSDICRRLRARNLPVRGLVRAGSAGESGVRALGVEISTRYFALYLITRFLGDGRLKLGGASRKA